MKQLIWIALFIVVAVTAAGWGSHSWQRLSAVPEVGIDRNIHTSQNPSPLLLPAEKNAFSLPQIDQSRLWKHVETLAGEREGERARSFTRDYISQQLQTLGFSPDLQEFDRGINVFAERKGTDSNSGAILVEI
ncbi:MAG: peptidase M28, partial [Cyanobacteria bacterium 0813]|nr:peptidase M28 [Cyanobacteria bacterium 0813]